MKMKKTLTAVLIVGAFSLTTGLAIAEDLPTRGPVPFSSWDADGNGTIDEQEFNTMREKRQAAVKADGRRGKNMANAPAFARIDTDGDGKITAEELSARQQKYGNRQFMGKGRHGSGKGMQQGQGNRQSMGKGHHGNGQAMMGTMGSRYQAMDAETKAKYDVFFAATSELRKEMAAKRAAKMAVMRSTNPDPEQAAQLARELFDLRSQMRIKAQEAGIDIGYGFGHNHGFHGKGPGCKMRG